VQICKDLWTTLMREEGRIYFICGYNSDEIPGGKENDT